MSIVFVWLHTIYFIVVKYTTLRYINLPKTTGFFVELCSVAQVAVKARKLVFLKKDRYPKLSKGGHADQS